MCKVASDSRTAMVLISGKVPKGLQVLTIASAVPLGFGNSYNEFWVRGSLGATGVINFGTCKSERGANLFIVR